MSDMKNIRIEKLTLNIGVGKSQETLDKAIKLLGLVTNAKPVKCLTKKRIPTWGLRPGLPIGAKVTIRGSKTESLLKRLLDAKEYKLKKSCFDNTGNVSFGIPEYLDIGGMKYDPEIGSLGLQVSVTLDRKGYRIKKRALLQKKIPNKLIISREESMNFLTEKFNVKVGAE